MKPSQIFGGEEECESSESGWTMYIGSPIEDVDEELSDDGDNDDDDDITQADPEVESDDSMASDASSGPSHNNQHWGNGKGGYDDLAGFKKMIGEKYDDGLGKNENKTLENQRKGEKVEKKKMIFIDGKSKSPVQVGCNGKVRKNYWVGKRNK